MGFATIWRVYVAHIPKAGGQDVHGKQSDSAEMKKMKKPLPRNGTINEKTHEWTGDPCPYCGYELKRFKKTGFIFCCNHEMICGYELDAQIQEAM